MRNYILYIYIIYIIYKYITYYILYIAFLLVLPVRAWLIITDSSEHFVKNITFPIIADYILNY